MGIGITCQEVDETRKTKEFFDPNFTSTAEVFFTENLPILNYWEWDSSTETSLESGVILLIIARLKIV